MSFEQPSFPQESGRESIREDLLRKIEALNGLQESTAFMDIDDVDMRPEAIDEQARFMADVFAAAVEHPEEFLDLADKVHDPETRRDLTGKAAVGLGARGDAVAFEAALERHREGLRAMDWTESLIETDTEMLRMDALEKRIQSLIDAGDVPAAVETYQKEYAWRSPDIHNRIAGPVQKFVGEGEGLAGKLENYRRLPDAFPGMGPDDFTMQIFRGESLGLDRMPLEERKALIEEKFAQAPDILARVSINRYLTGWTQEDRARIFKDVRDAGNRESVLSYFLAYDFTPEDFQELKPDLFAAYRKFRTDAILDRIGEFAEPFDSLPDVERKAMIDGWVEKKPEMLVYRLGKTLRLDAGQEARIFDHLIEHAPARLTDPEFLGKLGWDERNLVDRAIKAGKVQALLDQHAGLSNEAVTALLDEILEHPPKGFVFDVAPFIARGIEIDPERLQTGMRKLFAGGRPLDLMLLERTSGARLDVARLSAEELGGVKLTRIAREIEYYPELEPRLPMAGLLGKLEKIQGRAARLEHDPWERDLDPLLARAYQEGFLSPEAEKDAELFVEFVKEFGAANTPKLLETYVGLKRAKTVEEIPAGVRGMLEETLGAKRVAKMKTPAFLLNEIRKFERGMVSDLLKDEIPAGMTSELGLEIFDVKKGSSSWDQDDDPKELIGKWERYRKGSPEAAKVPEGYEESLMKIPLAVREKKGFGMDIVGEDRVGKAFHRYANAFFESGRTLDPIAPEDVFAGEEVEAHIYNLAVEYGGFQVPDGVDFNRFMEELTDIGSENSRRLLFSLSINQLVRTAPGDFAKIIERTREEGSVDVDRLRDLRNLLVDYVAEHYLHPSQAAHRVGHTPFSEKLRAELLKVWGLEDGGENAVIDAHGRIEAQRKKNARTSQKTKDIALVPAQGLLRIYGGDIADACYTSRHNELAEGKYPDLHAMIFVTGRGTASERFAGSVLFVEAETQEGGQKVLMVRANNPRENLIQEVDAAALVKQTLDAAIAIARERGLDMVVVPLDDASQSSSNRPAVADYYWEHYGETSTVGLARKSETNFNSYPNWDRTSEHGVVPIWIRKYDDKEPG